MGRKCWDARCLGCDSVHIIRLAEDSEHEAGDELSNYPHKQGRTACMDVAPHRLISRLKA